jgi:thymidylate synthase
MRDGFPLLTTKKMAWKTMVTELLWFLIGDTKIKFLVDNVCHIWDGDAYKNYCNTYPNVEKTFKYEGSDIEVRKMTKDEFINMIKTDDEFAKKWGELGPIYGAQWRKWGGLQDLTDDDKPIYLDQISNLISELKTNPDSRRLMVSAWNVGELNQMVLPPCHYGFQVYTRELTPDERVKYFEKNPESWPDNEMSNVPKRAISLMWNQRSVDTFLGLPFNIASYALLLEIIAKAVNMIPDELIGTLGDVHLYNNHIEQAKEQITRTPFELPKLNINTEFWPTESGSCGEGSLDAVAVFNSFKDDNFCKCLLEEDIQLINYQSHPSIKAPLSN